MSQRLSDRLGSAYARVRDWSTKRPVRAWALVAAITVAALLGATQVAKHLGQSVDWYGAFGGWLGAIASVFAGAVALWITTTDRRRNDALRTASDVAEEKKLAREAGLARVSLGQIVPSTALRPDLEDAIVLTNWRRSNLFDVVLDEVTVAGAYFDPTGVKKVDYYPSDQPPRRIRPLPLALERVVLQPREILGFFLPAGAVADYAAFRYTDDTGRQWSVDSRVHTAEPVLDPETGEI